MDLIRDIKIQLIAILWRRRVIALMQAAVVRSKDGKEKEMVKLD